MTEYKHQGPAYMLSRDVDASTRLTGQHFLLVMRSGGLLLPAVELVARKPGARIVDVATGNAIWATHAAQTFTDAEVVGLDISDRQFPAARTLPQNVSLEIYNVLHPVHDKYKGYFDVVNIRLLTGGLEDFDDCSKVITNCADLLKPGGYLHWHDAQFPGWQVLDRSLSVDNKQLPPFVALVDQLMNGRLAKHFFPLQNLVANHPSFGEVQEYEPPVMSWLLPYETTFAAKVLGEIIRVVRNAFTLNKEKLVLAEKAEHALNDYLAHGGLITYKTTVITARKVEK